MNDDKSGAQPVRKSERLQHELLVAYRKGRLIASEPPEQDGSGDRLTTDWAVNISRGGIFINTPKPLPVGSVVKLKISLPDAAAPFDLTGKVIRVHPPDPSSDHIPGMGIEFIEVAEDKKCRLALFVDRLRAELPDAMPPKK